MNKGLTFTNNEAAFQAQKTLSESERLQFTTMQASQAKKMGRKVTLREDWEDSKDGIMYEICKEKFSNEEMKKKLLTTGRKILIEGNNWGDKEWGQVQGEGKNKLGKILMRVRTEIQSGVY